MTTFTVDPGDDILTVSQGAGLNDTIQFNPGQYRAQIGDFSGCTVDLQANGITLIGLGNSPGDVDIRGSVALTDWFTQTEGGITYHTHGGLPAKLSQNAVGTSFREFLTGTSNTAWQDLVLDREDLIITLAGGESRTCIRTETKTNTGLNANGEIYWVRDGNEIWIRTGQGFDPNDDAAEIALAPTFGTGWNLDGHLVENLSLNAFATAGGNTSELQLGDHSNTGFGDNQTWKNVWVKHVHGYGIGVSRNNGEVVDCVVDQAGRLAISVQGGGFDCHVHKNHMIEYGFFSAGPSGGTGRFLEDNGLGFVPAFVCGGLRGGLPGDTSGPTGCVIELNTLERGWGVGIWFDTNMSGQMKNNICWKHERGINYFLEFATVEPPRQMLCEGNIAWHSGDLDDETPFRGSNPVIRVSDVHAGVVRNNLVICNETGFGNGIGVRGSNRACGTGCTYEDNIVEDNDVFHFPPKNANNPGGSGYETVSNETDKLENCIYRRNTFHRVDSDTSDHAFRCNDGDAFFRETIEEAMSAAATFQGEFVGTGANTNIVTTYADATALQDAAQAEWDSRIQDIYNLGAPRLIGDEEPPLVVTGEGIDLQVSRIIQGLLSAPHAETRVHRLDTTSEMIGQVERRIFPPPAILPQWGTAASIPAVPTLDKETARVLDGILREALVDIRLPDTSETL